MSLHSNSVIHLAIPASPPCSAKIKKRYFKLEFDAGTKGAEHLTSTRQHEIMKWLSNSGVDNVNKKNNEDLSTLLKNYFERKENKKQKKHALHVIFGVAGKYKPVTNVVVKAT